jgi:hypothetical protein
MQNFASFFHGDRGSRLLLRVQAAHLCALEEPTRSCEARAAESSREQQRAGAGEQLGGTATRNETQRAQRELTKIRLVVANSQALDLSDVRVDGDHELLGRVTLDLFLVAQNTARARTTIAWHQNTRGELRARAENERSGHQRGERGALVVCRVLTYQ